MSLRRLKGKPEKPDRSMCPMQTLLASALTLMTMIAALPADTLAASSVKWVQGQANCTVRTEDEGHTYYGLSYGDFEITLSVDSQELEKVPHRVLPFIAVFLSFHYKGSGRLDILQNEFDLEFVKHRQVVQTSLNPDEMLETIQNNMDDVTYDIEREIRKHPEQKGKKDAELQQRVKDYIDMMNFISERALHPTMLNTTNSTVDGWVFFSTKSPWIGSWRRPEDLLLRLPIERVVVEFPFQLPSQMGKVRLRRRPSH
jgi:hypothetical protein